MMWMIARREFIDHFKSARFVIGLVLALSASLAVALTGTQDYEQRLRDHHAAPEALKVDWIHPMAFHRPTPLSILARGDEVRLGSRVNITYRQMPFRPTSYSGEAGQDPFAGPVVLSVDFVFVVKVVLSLLVLFLMYDSVSGENERGTLSLVLSVSLRRSDFLTGKFLGGLITSLVAVSLCGALTLAVMASSPSVELRGEHLARTVAVFSACFLSLGVYCAVSLLISTATRRSSTALLVAILVWVMSIGFLPSVSVQAARFLFPVPSQEEVHRRLAAAAESIDSQLRESQKAFSQAVRTNKVTSDLRLHNHDLTVEAARLRWQVYREVLNRMSAQRHVAKLLMVSSPAGTLELAAASLAGTDVEAIKYFLSSARALAVDFGLFIRSQITDRANWSKDQMPGFKEHFEPFGDALARTIWPLLVTASLAAICFLAAQVVFSRYEVRHG